MGSPLKVINEPLESHQLAFLNVNVNSFKIQKQLLNLKEFPSNSQFKNQNINTNSRADWSVWNLRGKTIKTKKIFFHIRQQQEITIYAIYKVSINFE